MNRFSISLALKQKKGSGMIANVRTAFLVAGCILTIGTSAARAQMPLVFYYPAPGNYATTQGTVNIPAIGYYYNVPLFAVPAPANPAPAQGFTDSNSSLYSPRSGASTVGGGGLRANVLRSEPTKASTYVSGDGQANPDW